MVAKEFDVAGIGNAIVDLLVEVSFEEFKTFGVEAGSMNLVDENGLTSLRNKLGAKDMKVSSGGSGANTCVALSSLGNRVSYSCIVGDDDMGKGYENEFKDLNISLCNKRVAGQTTGMSLLMVTPDAERTMNTFLGVTSTFGPEHVDIDRIAKSEWLYIEGYLFSTENGKKAIYKALEVAEKNNVKIAVTCSDGFIVDLFKEDVIATCKRADLIFANRNEALRLTDTSDEDAALTVLRGYADTVVITLSDKGAIAAHKEEVLREQSFLVTAVDDTGAGDMFAAGFLDSMIKRKSLRECVLIGSFLASRVVSQFGARLGHNLDRFIKENEELNARL